MVWGFFAASGPGRLTAKGSVPKFQQRARLISSYKYILAFSWSWLMWKFQGFYDCLSSHILLTYITRLFAIFQRSKWTVQMILVPRTTLWTLTRDLSRYWGVQFLQRVTLAWQWRACMHAVTYVLYMFTLTCTDIRANVIATPASFPSVYIAPQGSPSWIPPACHAYHFHFIRWCHCAYSYSAFSLLVGTKVYSFCRPRKIIITT